MPHAVLILKTECGSAVFSKTLRRWILRRDGPMVGLVVLSAKARALLRSRYHVAYEDIRALATPILRHRILLNFHAESERLDSDAILKRLLDWKPEPK